MPGSGRPFAYYETMGGGAGAGPEANGGSGLHVHMSNTLNTPVEALEYSFPLRLEQYSLRPHSGGAGQHPGGDGLVRSIRFLTPVTVTVTSERRKRGAYGLQGGQDGRPGRNRLIQGETTTELPGKFTRQLEADDVLQIETPGGGGWGEQFYLPIVIKFARLRLRKRFFFFLPRAPGAGNLWIVRYGGSGLARTPHPGPPPRRGRESCSLSPWERAGVRVKLYGVTVTI